MDSQQSNIPVSIRLNPFKGADLSHLQEDGQVPWCEQAFYLKERPSFTLDPLFHAGAYYVQDSSAMFVGWMFRRALDLLKEKVQDDAVAMKSCTVLDLCAAPGGKTTDAAASLREAFGSSFLLVSNEVIRQRCSVLADNVALWGDPNVAVTSSDPAAFAKLDSFFDIVIADVPCSGEGMFRKSENARNMWSEDNVALCAARSRRIVSDMWDALSPGGILVYSTCTLNNDENDANVKWFIENLGAESYIPDMPFDGPEPTQYGFLLTPGKVRGEGQYCALLVKSGEFEPDRPLQRSKSRGRNQNCGSEAPDSVAFFTRGEGIVALPAFAAERMETIGKAVSVVNAGTKSFIMKGKDRIPQADLALSLLLTEDDFPVVELDRQDALRFLHKDAIVLKEAPTGYVIVSYGGLPLGFMKNLGSRANNLHPSGRRILMNIE